MTSERLKALQMALSVGDIDDEEVKECLDEIERMTEEGAAREAKVQGLLNAARGMRAWLWDAFAAQDDRYDAAIAAFEGEACDES